MKIRIYYLFIVFLLHSTPGFAQHTKRFKIPDSLKNMSYEEIYEKAVEFFNDTTKISIYGNTYLEKAKQENELTEMSDGYAIVSHSKKEEYLKLKYLDSAVLVVKDSDHPYYPTLPYSLRGGYYYHRLNFKKALDNFLLSKEAAEKNNNEVYVKIAERSIAHIKSKLGKYDEVLLLNKRAIKNYEKEGMENRLDTSSYVSKILLISEVYTKMKVLDSSTFYIEKGMKFSHGWRGPSDNLYYHFVLGEGINHYYRENYQIALDSIHKTVSFLSNDMDKNYILKAYLYLGKTYDKTDQKDKARDHYQKVDSIYQVSGNVSLELREAYSGLANYYKNKRDLKNQLYYIEKLVEFDSIYNENYKLMDQKILEEYDIPNLVKQKEEIIASLEAEKTANKIQIGVISLFLVLSLGGVGYYYRNQRLYKKRFVQLLDTSKKDDTKTITKEIPKEKSSGVTIPQETLDHLMSKLQQFEEKQGFLKPKINAKDLAKSFDSNSSYLSIVVNTYKQKSISQYINDLRINFAIEKLKADPKFRKYTIKAIAQEVGFNTSEAFAKTFYKNTGIYPSYFIKNLEK